VEEVIVDAYLKPLLRKEYHIGTRVYTDIHVHVCMQAPSLNKPLVVSRMVILPVISNVFDTIYPATIDICIGVCHSRFTVSCPRVGPPRKTQAVQSRQAMPGWALVGRYVVG